MVLRRLLVALCLLGLAAPPAAAAAPAAAYVPPQRALYHDGPRDRYLLAGAWLYRADPHDTGLARNLEGRRSTTGWSRVSVPDAWNANDDSVASMAGGVGWYRKDFELPDPSAAYDWIVRFESVNYHATVWLNGHRLGGHMGAFLPFELRLRHLRRHGVNRLVVRVDSRRHATDLPPAGLNASGRLIGGWWNYGGILREVYLRRIDRVDMQDVVVRPLLGCPQCNATVEVSTTVRNYASRPERVQVTGSYGTQPLDLGTQTVPAGGTASFSDAERIRHPELWSPEHPNLYRAVLRAGTLDPGAARPVERERYVVHSGIRDIEVKDGRLYLNGEALDVRGVGLHEDAQGMGMAIDSKVRRGYIRAAKDLGATIIRAHYPLHPQLEELADRKGILLWSEIPVYSVQTQYLGDPRFRRNAARFLADNIATNQNHPSILLWSIGNELASQPDAKQARYIADAVAQAHRLDPTRPVGLAIAGYPAAGCQAAYAPLDVIGLNDYFGWYPGPDGQIADRELLPGFLDEMRSCYPDQALMVTEFGAEANRHGPVEERGTYEFQDEFIDYHLGVYATKPWLSGAIYWALDEFKVHPGWDGGNPYPDPPLHEKGLISYSGYRKPAYDIVKQQYHATQQFMPPAATAARRRR